MARFHGALGGQTSAPGAIGNATSQRIVAIVLVAALALLLVASATQGAVDPTARNVGIVECSEEVRNKHHPGQAAGIDHLICFEAYISNFNTDRREDDRGVLRSVGIPRWVSQHVGASAHSPESRERPRAWFTVPELARRGVAPTDASYNFTKAFRNRNKNWYEKGHLAQKYLAERIGRDAGRFTHNVANAVPQLARFNKSAWLSLECHTGAWANRYGEVWVISGPIFADGRPSKWLRSNKRRDAMPVAIPSNLFKVVVRKSDAGDFEALAFVYPQDDPTYKKGPWPPGLRLVSISQVEALSGVTILPALDQGLKNRIATKVWPVERADFDRSCKRFAEKERG